MKKSFLSLLAFLIFLQCRSATCRWDGEAFNNEWLDPLNWVDDVLPLADDEVLLDNSIVAGSYDVFFPGGDIAVTVRKLTILPSLPDRIRLVLPPSNISLTAFRATGEDDAVVIGDGAELVNESGASTSSTPIAVTAAGTFRINNGGRYIHRTARSATDNLVSRLSAAAGTEHGVFEFDVTVASYIISLSGRNFGSLELNAATNAAMVNYRGSGGNPLNIRGDLLLHRNVTFTLSLSSTTQIDGSLVQDSMSTFNLQSTHNNNVVRVAGACSVKGVITETGTGGPMLELNGMVRQQVDLHRALLQEVVLSINNPEGCMLVDSLMIPFQLDLIQGRVSSASDQPVIFETGATWTRTDGLIESMVVRKGTDDFIYPVGAGNIYAPMQIRAGNPSSGNGVGVQYKRMNPQTQVGISFDHSGPVSIDHLSAVEYWEVSPGIGPNNGVTLAINPESFCSDLSNTFIVQSSGTTWRHTGSSIITGPDIAGSFETGVLSGEMVDEASRFFTIGTAMPVSQNPLPVELLFFEGIRENGTGALFRWEVTELPPASGVFVLSMVGNVGKDSMLTVIPVIPSTTRYHFHLRSLPQGIRRYRLRLSDREVPVFLSRIITIEQPANLREKIFSVYPNPSDIHSQVNILLSENFAGELQVLDFSGRIVERINTRFWYGSNVIPLSLKHLPPGCYVLRGISTSGQTNSVCFVRR